MTNQDGATEIKHKEGEKYTVFTKTFKSGHSVSESIRNSSIAQKGGVEAVLAMLEKDWRGTILRGGLRVKGVYFFDAAKFSKVFYDKLKRDGLL